MNKEDDAQEKAESERAAEAETTADKPWLTDPELAPRVIPIEGRIPRFGLSQTKLSPYILIDGKVIRSALHLSAKNDNNVRRVSFPRDESLVAKDDSVDDPDDPENMNCEDLISMYRTSCERHDTNPLESVITQLKNLNLREDRSDDLILKGTALDYGQCESLEEIFKRVHFNLIDLEDTSLNDECSVALFEMFEYYDSVARINISYNPAIRLRGWITFSHFVKKTECLEFVEASGTTFDEQSVATLSRSLRLASHLHVLKLDNCNLSGSNLTILSVALRDNAGLRELYLSNNNLTPQDAKHIGTLVRVNRHLRLLDISNNQIGDSGAQDVLTGLSNHIDQKGLNVLSLWNNELTHASYPHFCQVLDKSKSLVTLNVGKNAITNETIEEMKETLKKNHVLLQLGLQSTEITCDGIRVLVEILEANETLQRIDLRDNVIQGGGLTYLALLMKNNPNVTRIDIDDRPTQKIDISLQQYKELITEIRECCERNTEAKKLAEEEGENAGSADSCSRLSSTKIRKISLTCQLLPPMKPMSVDSVCLNKNNLRTTLPIPNTIPPHVTNTISTPSRNRFLVSRVHEVPLTSVNGITA